MASTLQGFVSSVVGKVIVFVLLEEVTGVHLVAVLHQTLLRERRFRDCLCVLLNYNKMKP